MKKYRDAEGKFIIEGDHLVNIALEKGLVDELILLEDNYNFDNKYIVSQEVMNKITSQITASKVMAVCHYNYVNDFKGNCLIIDGLQDPGNLGTIIRSAAAFNFETIILGDNTVDLYNDKVIRASEGMLFNVNFIKKNVVNAITELKSLNYKILGTDVKKGVSITKKDHIAIIIGNEGAGLSSDIKKMCDELVHIPMKDDCESLNAGVAASILMYEVYHE